MPVLKNVLGLDVGTHTLKAVELHQTLRSLDVVRMHAIAREPDTPLHAQIARLLLTHSFQRDNVVAAVRGDRLAVHRLSFPFSERRRLAQAVPFELEDRVPFEMEDMVLDWQPLTRDRQSSEVISVLAPRSEVSGLIETLHEASCDPRTIEAEGLALANLAALFDLPSPCIVVDIGHSKTSFCSLRDGVAIASRSVSVAGRALTEAIAQERALSLEDAERYKHQYGVVEPGVGNPFPRAEAVIQRLGGEVLRFASSLETLLPNGVGPLVLVGGSAQLAHLDAHLTKATGLPCQSLGAAREEAGDGLDPGQNPAIFAPALALAVRGTAGASTELNLRQDEFARRTDFSWLRRQFGSTSVLAAVVAALALVSFSIGAILEAREASQLEEQVTALYTEAFPNEEVPDNPVTAMREAVREAETRAEFLGVYRGNMSALDVLTEISKRVPESLDVGFEELSIDKQTIRIRVYAKSFEAADRLGSELSKFGPFAQAQIGTIETDSRSGAKKFNVTISLAGDEGSS